MEKLRKGGRGNRGTGDGSNAEEKEWKCSVVHDVQQTCHCHEIASKVSVRALLTVNHLSFADDLVMSWSKVC